VNDRTENSIQKLISIVERLRGPDGCPWDKAQTTASLRPYLLEECHEYLCAIEQSCHENIRDELGDLLLQVVLHAQIFKEQKQFTLEDAAESICEKLIRRHPHVFTEQTSDDIDLDLQWEAIKLSERSNANDDPSLFDSIETTIPPLQYARKISEKAKRIGLDWPDTKSVLNKIREEVDELEDALQSRSQDEISHELGDLLFATVNIARHLDIDTEIALHQTNIRFTNRVRQIESILKQRNKSFKDLSITELDSLWEKAKQIEKNLNRS
jgi:MazG family protein